MSVNEDEIKMNITVCIGHRSQTFSFLTSVAAKNVSDLSNCVFLRCPDGYVGSRCQFRDPCLSSPCMNGGMCRAVPKGNTVDYSCTCRLGYSDRRCLTPINNVCISSLCHNGGTCELESLQTYRCRCPPGWSGNAEQVL